MAVFTRLQSKIDTKVLGIEFSWLTYVTIFSGLVEVMALISGVLSQRPISEAVIFTTYQVAAILILGLAYVELLKVEFCKTGAARILLAYAVGYASNIAIYYILYWLGELQKSPILIWGCLILQLSVSFFVLCKKKVRLYENQNNFLMVFLLIGIMFTIELFTYCGSNMLPVIFGTGWEIQLLCNRIIRRLIFGR